MKKSSEALYVRPMGSFSWAIMRLNLKVGMVRTNILDLLIA